MIRINRSFDTEAEAIQFKEDMLRQYHPCGYGTKLNISSANGQWHVTGHRFSSCD